jgi:hypothetical protein
VDDDLADDAEGDVLRWCVAVLQAQRAAVHTDVCVTAVEYQNEVGGHWVAPWQK